MKPLSEMLGQIRGFAVGILGFDLLSLITVFDSIRGNEVLLNGIEALAASVPALCGALLIMVDAPKQTDLRYIVTLMAIGVLGSMLWVVALLWSLSLQSVGAFAVFTGITIAVCSRQMQSRKKREG